MAKRTKPLPKQERIPGTYDPLPKAVEKARDAYVEAKREAAEASETKKQKAIELIDLMQEHDVLEMPIDDGEKRLVLEADCKLKIKTIKGDEGKDEA